MSHCVASLQAVNGKGTMLCRFVIRENLICSNTEQKDLGNTIANYDAEKAKVSVFFSSHLYQC